MGCNVEKIIVEKFLFHSVCTKFVREGGKTPRGRKC